MRIIKAFKAFFTVFFHPENFDKLNSKPEVKTDPAHLRLLKILQSKSRLIDFLQEDLSSYSDAEVGAAVRRVHEEAAKTIDELVTIRPIFTESEGSSITIAADYDPAKIKLIGNIDKKPPFTGVLRHKGWKAHKINLPKQIEEIGRDVIAPAEVEL